MSIQLLSKSLLTKKLYRSLACIGVTEDGQALNINGDTVASEIALAVGAESLLLVTEIWDSHS